MIIYYFQPSDLQCPGCECVDETGTLICCPCFTTTTATPSSGNTGHCFPSTARVSLENGNSRRMAELQVGDMVQTGTSCCFVKIGKGSWAEKIILEQNFNRILVS